MNFLFTFTDCIEVSTLIEFEAFCWELDEIICITTSANDNDEGAEFPPNFIMVYVDCDNKDHLESISHKYHQLCIESNFIQTTEYSKSQSIQQ